MIKGDKSTIELIKNARPGDPCVLVAWDAISCVSNFYDVQVTKLPFLAPTPQNPGDFSPVAGSSDTFMPTPELLNKIASAAGVQGLDMGSCQAITQDIDWNRMTLNYIDPPRMVKYLVGYEVVKQGEVLTEDGSKRRSDPCFTPYNAWERVCELFSSEEVATDCYKKCTIDKNGQKIYQSEWKGNKKTKWCKYDTRAKRQKLFDSEIKFAERKADTKARNGVIRSLCGLPTGFKVADLRCGYFILSKIVKSSEAIQAEHAARLECLSGGRQESAVTSLYGPSKTPEPVSNPVPTPQTEPEKPAAPSPAKPVQTTSTLADEALQGAHTKPEPVKITAAIAIKAFTAYKESSLVDSEKMPAVENVLKWLSSAKDAEQSPFWSKAVTLLGEIEAKIPEGMLCR